MANRTIVLQLLALASLASCASDLVIKDENGKDLPGIQVRSYEMWVQQGQYTKASNGKDCSESPFQQIASLPSGPAYYANVHSAQLAKTQFTLKLDANGALSEVTLNSESQGPALLTSVADVMKALPLAALGAGAPSPSLKQPCDAGPKVDRMQRFSSWLKDHP